MSRPRLKATATTTEAVIYDLKPKPSEKDMEQVRELMCKVLSEDRTLIIQKKHNGVKGFYMALTEVKNERP